jgi:hypothetical protein
MSLGFSQISQFMSGGSQNQPPPPPEENGSQNLGQQMGLDSITLGQLRAMVNSAPKPKVWHSRMFTWCSYHQLVISNPNMTFDMTTRTLS